jgi:chemotaxis protein CheC
MSDARRQGNHRADKPFVAYPGKPRGSDLNDQNDSLLNARQLELLESAFHRGATDASRALAKWIGRQSVVEIDSLDQLPLEEATDVLAASGEPICFCATQMCGLLAGEMILVFDDESGFALADMLLDRPRGTTDHWTELATSVAQETTNILCCAYLSSLARSFSKFHEAAELLPSPPRFSRDFAACLLEFAFMGQVETSNQVILARTRFEIDAIPINWTLLFIPDALSKLRLLKLLPADDAEHETTWKD